MGPSHEMLRNRLLGALLPEDYDFLRPDLSVEEYESGHILVEARAPATRIWFTETAIASVILSTKRGNRAEAGIVGRDGCTPLGALTVDDISAFQVLIQVQGSGLAAPVTAVRALIDARPGARDVFTRFTHTQYIQTAHTALVNSTYAVEERLARWLLMCHDRVDRDELLLTHEFLSVMLAVRRPSVTVAMHLLEGERFISARRARITIVDRAGLEEFAGDAYGAPEAAYERLIGPLRRAPDGRAAR